MIIRLEHDKGYHEFIIPEEEYYHISDAGTLLFRDTAFSFRGIISGRLVFGLSGPSFVLKEEWLS